MPTNAKAGCLYPNNGRAVMEAKSRGFDNALVLDGFAVLRFTNDEVVDDPQRVVATIETLLSTRRRKGEQP